MVEINEYRSHVLTVERERVPGLHYKPAMEYVCVFSRNSFGLCDPGLASSDTGNGGIC